MNTLWIAVSGAVGAVALGYLVVDRLFGYDLRIERRIQHRHRELTTGTSEVSPLFREAQLMQTGRHYLRRWLQQFVEQSGLTASLRQLCLASIALGSGLATLLLFAPFRWIVAPLGAIAGILLPWLFVAFRRRRRVERLRRQLPEALDSMARALQAGQSVASALQIIATECRDPLAREFACVCEQQNLGLSFEASLQELSRRIPILELRILSIALIVQRQAGGNPVEIITNMSDLVRKRLRLADRVRALTGEGRMQAIVLTLLPIIAFFGLWLGRPEYIRPLLERPRMLLSLVLAQAVAGFWIRRIVRTVY